MKLFRVSIDPKPTTEVPTTMQVDKAKLARRFGLPTNASESMIRARLAGLEAEQHVRAASSGPSAGGRRLDSATVRALSDAELRSLAASPLSGPDRQAVADETTDRAFLAAHFPGTARALGREVRPRDLSARSGDVLNGPGYA
jgi:hypothetical protein